MNRVEKLKELSNKKELLFQHWLVLFDLKVEAYNKFGASSEADISATKREELQFKYNHLVDLSAKQWDCYRLACKDFIDFLNSERMN